jgi:photosystem II stability/assembly factor-like uncharacterized protein
LPRHTGEMGRRCGGLLMFTADGGHSWRLTDHRVDRFSVAHDKAWHSGVGRWIELVIPDPASIARSLDGGATWEHVVGENTPRVRYVQFLTTEVGWIDTDRGYFQTMDGGATWMPYPLGAPISGADRPVFTDDSTVLAFKNNALWRSEDAGRTWDNQGFFAAPSSYQPDRRLTLGGPGNLWLMDATRGPCQLGNCRATGALLNSTDGGRSWQPLPSIPRFGSAGNTLLAWGDLLRGRVVASGRGTLGRSALFFSEDGGATWSRAAPDPSLATHSVSYVENGDVWIVQWLMRQTGDPTNGLLWRLPDGAEHATGYDLGLLLPTQVQFITPTRGWLVRYDGGLLTTADGGATWQQLHPALSAGVAGALAPNPGEWREGSDEPARTIVR